MTTNRNILNRINVFILIEFFKLFHASVDQFFAQFQPGWFISLGSVYERVLLHRLMGAERGEILEFHT